MYDYDDNGFDFDDALEGAAEVMVMLPLIMLLDKLILKLIEFLNRKK